MTEEVVATEAVAPEAVEESQAKTVEAEESAAPEEEAKKSAAKERRERDKAYKARLREEKEAALIKAADAEGRIERIKAAGSVAAEPVEKDYADYTEYVAAKAVWRHAKGMAERDVNEVSNEAQAARQAVAELTERERALAMADYNAAAQEAKGRYADFDAVVRQPGLFPTGTHLPDLVLQSDAPADVAYAIASDRNLHDSLLRASPIEAARIIGRIEAQIALPKARTQSAAPDPISPVRGKAAATLDPAKMSMEEYIAGRKSGKIR